MDTSEDGEEEHWGGTHKGTFNRTCNVNLFLKNKKYGKMQGFHNWVAAEKCLLGYKKWWNAWCQKSTQNTNIKTQME